MPIDINDRNYYPTHFYGKWMRSLADAEIVANVGDQVVIPYCTTLRVATVVDRRRKRPLPHNGYRPVVYRVRLHEQTGYNGYPLSDPGKVVQGWRDETEGSEPGLFLLVRTVTEEASARASSCRAPDWPHAESELRTLGRSGWASRSRRP